MPDQRNKDMSGVLFKNRDKKNDNQPDYTGECVIRGETLRIAAWVNESKRGTKYFRFTFSEPRERDQNDSDSRQPQQSPTPAHREPAANDLDDIPFAPDGFYGKAWMA